MTSGLATLRKVRRRFLAELRSWCNEDGVRFSDLNDEIVVSLPAVNLKRVADLDDFPLLSGREITVRALYRGKEGQAISPVPGSFKGSLADVMKLPLKGVFERAVLISTVNAVLRHRGVLGGTAHCKSYGPDLCASWLKNWITEQEVRRAGLVGARPELIEALVGVLGEERVMAADMMEAGNVFSGVEIMYGTETQRIFECCQLVLASGSTLANGTIDGLFEAQRRHNRKLVFYGTSVAGTAYLMGLERWCPCST